jgi:hypothetical protein
MNRLFKESPIIQIVKYNWNVIKTLSNPNFLPISIRKKQIRYALISRGSVQSDPLKLGPLGELSNKLERLF